MCPFLCLCVLLLCEQVLLEVCKVSCHRCALFCALHEGLELGRNVDALAEDAVHSVLELGWVGCLKEDACLSGLETFLQRSESAGSVGVAYIACGGHYLADGVRYL